MHRAEPQKFDWAGDRPLTRECWRVRHSNHPRPRVVLRFGLNLDGTMGHEKVRFRLLGLLSSPRTPIVLFIALLAAAFSCKITPHIDEAKAAVERFHQRLDAEQYSAIYSETDDSFRRVTSQADFINLLSAIHRKLGRERSKQVTGWAASTSFTTIVFHTKFADGDAVERFKWRMINGKAWLTYYNINSNALVVK